jgi:hypothetical protein
VFASATFDPATGHPVQQNTGFQSEATTSPVQQAQTAVTEANTTGVQAPVNLLSLSLISKPSIFILYSLICSQISIFSLCVIVSPWFHRLQT